MRANPNYPPNVPYIEPHGANHDRYVIQRNTGLSGTIQFFNPEWCRDPELVQWTWFQGDGMTISEAQSKLWDLVAGMAEPTTDCTPSCGYIGAECDYPNCKVPAAKPAPSAIDEAISSLLWCERRLKSSYGDLAHVQRAIAGLEAMKPAQVDDPDDDAAFCRWCEDNTIDPRDKWVSWCAWIGATDYLTKPAKPEAA